MSVISKERQQFASFLPLVFIAFLFVFQPVFAENFATSAHAPVPGSIQPANATPVLHPAPVFNQPAAPAAISHQPAKLQKKQQNTQNPKIVLTGTVQSVNARGFYLMTSGGVTYFVNVGTQTQFRNDTQLTFQKLSDVTVHANIRIFGIMNNSNKTADPDAMRLLFVPGQSSTSLKVNNLAKKPASALLPHPTPAPSISTVAPSRTVQKNTSSQPIGLPPSSATPVEPSKKPVNSLAPLVPLTHVPLHFHGRNVPAAS